MEKEKDIETEIGQIGREERGRRQSQGKTHFSPVHIKHQMPPTMQPLQIDCANFFLLS